MANTKKLETLLYTIEEVLEDSSDTNMEEYELIKKLEDFSDEMKALLYK